LKKTDVFYGLFLVAGVLIGAWLHTWSHESGHIWNAKVRQGAGENVDTYGKKMPGVQ